VAQSGTKTHGVTSQKLVNGNYTGGFPRARHKGVWGEWLKLHSF